MCRLLSMICFLSASRAGRKKLPCDLYRNYGTVYVLNCAINCVPLEDLLMPGPGPFLLLSSFPSWIFRGRLEYIRAADRPDRPDSRPCN